MAVHLRTQIIDEAAEVTEQQFGMIQYWFLALDRLDKCISVSGLGICLGPDAFEPLRTIYVSPVLRDACQSRLDTRFTGAAPGRHPTCSVETTLPQCGRLVKVPAFVEMLDQVSKYNAVLRRGLLQTLKSVLLDRA